MNAPTTNKQTAWRLRVGWTLGVVLFLAITIGGYQYRVRSSAARAVANSVAPPMLSVAPERLKLGTVWEQPALPWTLPIRNNSDHEIEIENFSKSCNCTDFAPRYL